MSSTLTVQDLFLQHQEEMLVALKGDRRNIGHPTAKGDSAELRWIQMLEAHLPHRYSVAKAFILDHAGGVSDQIDVVIFDNHYTPLFRAGQSARSIPAEGVYAVFEVRQELSKENLEYAADKAASVRRLLRTSAAINHAGGRFPPREPQEIVAGILALKSSWTPPFGKPFKTALANLRSERHLDLGCVLRDGAWQAPRAADSPAVVSASDTALMIFFLNLLSRLQQVATVSAIDFAAYASALSA